MQPYEDNAICKFRTLMKVTKKSQTPKTPKNLKASFGYWVAINKINENRIFLLPLLVDHMMADQSMLKVSENLSKIQFIYIKVSRATQGPSWLPLSTALPGGNSIKFIKVPSKIKGV